MIRNRQLPVPPPLQRAGGGKAGHSSSIKTNRMKTILQTICALALLGFASCNGFKQDPDPVPTAPISSVLPTYRFNWADTAMTIDFDSLVANKSVPYSLNFTQPALGRIVLVSDPLQMRYVPAQANWERDSCTYTLRQGEASGTGLIVFVNPAHVASCVQEPVIHKNIASALSGFDVQLVPTASSGRLVVWRAESYRADTLPGMNAKVLQYFAAGSGDTTNWGFDRVTYRWEQGSQCHEGMIEVTIGDTCSAGARPFTSAATSAHFIPYDTLARRSHGCRVDQPVDGIFYLKSRQAELPTLYGTVADTTIGGVRGFYYRRTVPGAQPDRFDYYYIHTGDFTNRVTRATITLSF